MGFYYDSDPEIYDMVERADELVAKAGGGLGSRQTIAAIIAVYEYVNSNRP